MSQSFVAVELGIAYDYDIAWNMKATQRRNRPQEL